MILDWWYWIVPNVVLFDPDIKDKELRVFIYVASLCAKKWYCRATNEHIAEKFKTSERTVSRYINTLKGKEYLVTRIRKYPGKNGDEMNTVRYIKIWNTDIKPTVKQEAWTWHREEVIEDIMDEIPPEAQNAIFGDQQNNNWSQDSKTPNLASNPHQKDKFGEHNNTIDNKKSTIKLLEEKELEEERIAILKKNVQTTKVLESIKKRCEEYWMAYSWDYEDRKFAKHIWSAKNFGDFSSKIWKTRLEFAKWILIASIQLEYFKWPTTSAERIYRNYSEVYNRRKIYEMKKQWMIWKNPRPQIEDLPSL